VVLTRVAYHITDVRQQAIDKLGQLLMKAPPFRPLLEADAQCEREVLLAEVRSL
jgi:hypothetical protein